jgi:hypothetical protein
MAMHYVYELKNGGVFGDRGLWPLAVDQTYLL